MRAGPLAPRALSVRIYPRTCNERPDVARPLGPLASADLPRARAGRGRGARGGAGAALRGLWEEGARAWPELELAPEAFVRYLAACGAASITGRSADLFAGVRTTDLYLAAACAARVRGAVEAFDRAHLRRLGAALARLRPSPELLDEVRQVLREKLFVGKDGARPKIAEYDGRAALASWVRVIAVRAAIDIGRRRKVAAAAPEEGSEPRTGDPEIEHLRRRYQHAFDEAFRGAVEDLRPELREVLRLHFIEGMTLNQLAVRLGVHRATVARRIATGREAVAGDARRRLRAALGASEDELESLTRVMRSQNRSEPDAGAEEGGVTSRRSRGCSASQRVARSSPVGWPRCS